jgi:hypothetical protein
LRTGQAMAGRRHSAELPNKIQRHYLWNCSERGQTLACLCAVKNDMRIPLSRAEKGMNWHRLVLELHQNPQRFFCEATGTDGLQVLEYFHLTLKNSNYMTLTHLLSLIAPFRMGGGASCAFLDTGSQRFTEHT